jgi:tetratricopeptide (TPR) repeat protein
MQRLLIICLLSLFLFTIYEQAVDAVARNITVIRLLHTDGQFIPDSEIRLLNKQRTPHNGVVTRWGLQTSESGPWPQIEVASISSDEPAHLLVHLDLGYVHWHRGENDRAVAHWQNTAGKQPTILNFLIQSVSAPRSFYTLPEGEMTWEAVASVGETAVATSPDEIALYIWMREIFSEKLMTPTRGIDWLLRARDRTGDHWQLAWLLYADHVAISDYEAAQVYLEEARLLDSAYRYKPEHEYDWRLGSLLLRQGDKEAAIGSLTACLEAAPDDVSCLLELGEAYYLTGDWVHAQLYFSRLDRGQLSDSRQKFVANRLTEIGQKLSP